VAGMALMTALTAFGSLFRLPFYPVPLSLQSVFPLIAGVLFPPGAAALTQLGYLLLGLMGLPLFSQGGGIAYMMQPTFGYLLAMPIAAALVAWGTSGLRKPLQVRSLFLVTMAGALFLLVFGTIWLYFSFSWIAGTPMRLSRALWLGLVLFIPGEAAKAAVSALAGEKFCSLFYK
jgi:biotin transport system substrate-specific component